MRLVLLGPPGAGKGTQAVSLKDYYEIPHISTGDIFRANIKGATELGKIAKQYIDAGKLVPDDITIKIVEDRIQKEDCQHGFIMDGFPRTILQAEMFDRMLADNGAKVDYVINIAVPDEVIIRRMSGRRVCVNGHSYHIYSNPPKAEGICDVCASPLFIRDDDNEETVIQRLKTYHQQTSPLIEFYSKSGLLVQFDGTKTIDNTFKEITSMLKG